MKFKPTLAIAALALSTVFVAMPTQANAQHFSLRSHRQHMKNDWRNMTYLGAGLGLVGALNNDPTLAFVGAAGALYSANRYEQDRESQNNMDRERAFYFSRGYYDNNGTRYYRHERDRNGTVYYYFNTRRGHENYDRDMDHDNDRDDMGHNH